MEALLKGRFTLGADAAVAAGPVGRNASAASDVMLKSEILSYSRSRGLFAGVSLEGAALLMDHDANSAFYEKNLLPADILAGKGKKTDKGANRLQELLDQYSKMK